METRTMKAYNVARVTDSGVEIIQLHPPLTKDQAREVRIRMKRMFRMNDYAVINSETILERCNETHEAAQ